MLCGFCVKEGENLYLPSKENSAVLPLGGLADGTLSSIALANVLWPEVPFLDNKKMADFLYV